MKLTKRELIAIVIVLFAGLTVLFYNFLYVPADRAVKALKEERSFLQEDEEEIRQLSLQVELMKKELKKLEEGSQELYEKMFDRWDQAENLVVIEKAIGDFCDRASIDSFTAVDVDSFQVGEVNLTLVTDYKNLHEILNAIEEADYDCTVNSTTISVRDREPQESKWTPIELDVNLHLRFYIKEQVYDFPTDYDFLDGTFNKGNIFVK